MHCEQKGKVLPRCRRCEGKREFSQGVRWFKSPGFSGAMPLFSTVLLVVRDLCKFILYPVEQDSCSVATRHHFQTTPYTLDQ